jgi:hypothetical protein
MRPHMDNGIRDSDSLSQNDNIKEAIANVEKITDENVFNQFNRR